MVETGDVVTDDILQQGMVDAITGHTAALNNVFSPRSWPTAAGVMPIILVQSPSEEKLSLGRSGASQFTCVTTVRVVARVYAKEGSGDAGAKAALAAVAVLKRQIEVAVLNNQDLRDLGVQQFKRVRSISDVKSEGEVSFGELVMDFDLEFYQGPEDFHPLASDDFNELAIYFDLLNVFSPSGDFEGDPQATPFAADAVPAPRTTGPDGRAEAAAIIPLPET